MRISDWSSDVCSSDLMRLGFAVDADVPMHVEIGDHAAFDELTLAELARERDPLLVRHLARDGELDLAGELRILALLDRLVLVPQRFADVSTLGPVVGQHPFGLAAALLALEIMIPPD